MSKFFTRLLFIFLIFSGALLAVNFVFENAVSKTKFYKLKDDPINIICGHSRPEYAYNDTLLNQTKNIAQSAESYFYTYIKLKKIVEANTQIKNVFLEFTENNIDENESNLWTYGNKYLVFRYIKYSSIMDLNEKKILFFHNPYEFFKSASLALNSNLTFALSSSKDIFSFKIMGGAKVQSGSHIDSLKASVVKEKKSATTSESFPVSRNPLNLIYLDKIIDLCKLNKLNIFFVRSPVYPAFKSVAIENIYDSIREARYPNIDLIDFSNYKLDDDDYYDYHHVNFKGRLKVTKSMDSIMNLIDKKPLTELFTNNRITVTN